MTNTAAPLESFGKIFQGDFIERNGMSLLQLASASGIPVAEIEAIIRTNVRSRTTMPNASVASSACPANTSRTSTPSTRNNSVFGKRRSFPSTEALKKGSRR